MLERPLGWRMLRGEAGGVSISSRVARAAKEFEWTVRVGGDFFLGGLGSGMAKIGARFWEVVLVGGGGVGGRGPKLGEGAMGTWEARAEGPTGSGGSEAGSETAGGGAGRARDQVP
jgi:hypothetical protein